MSRPIIQLPIARAAASRPEPTPRNRFGAANVSNEPSALPARLFRALRELVERTNPTGASELAGRKLRRHLGLALDLIAWLGADLATATTFALFRDGQEPQELADRFGELIEVMEGDLRDEARTGRRRWKNQGNGKRRAK